MGIVSGSSDLRVDHCLFTYDTRNPAGPTDVVVQGWSEGFGPDLTMSFWDQAVSITNTIFDDGSISTKPRGIYLCRPCGDGAAGQGLPLNTTVSNCSFRGRHSYVFNNPPYPPDPVDNGYAICVDFNVYPPTSKVAANGNYWGVDNLGPYDPPTFDPGGASIYTSAHIEVTSFLDTEPSGIGP